jgi:hypothetical protein
MNRRILFFVALVVLLLGACICPATRGSGKITTQSRDVSGFDQVSLGGSGELTITQGDEESLTIEAEDNLMSTIKTEVKGDTLYISQRSPWWRPRVLTKPVKFDLTMKEITGIKISGSGTVDAARIDSDDLDLDVSGSAEINIDLLTAETLEVDLSGSGEFNLAGLVTTQKVGISGSGKYRAGELESEAGKVKVSGSGKATVWVTETLDVKISGSGKVEYYGSPRASMDISGSGSVTALDD